jgi:hypothetical protein
LSNVHENRKQAIVFQRLPCPDYGYIIQNPDAEWVWRASSLKLSREELSTAAEGSQGDPDQA